MALVNHSSQTNAILALNISVNLLLVLRWFDLPMWPSGQNTQAPCAAERGALSDQGSNLSQSVAAY